MAAHLFGVCAAGLLGRRDDADAASFVSRLLIGDDVFNRLREDDRSTIYLIADRILGPLSAAAI